MRTLVRTTLAAAAIAATAVTVTAAPPALASGGSDKVAAQGFTVAGDTATFPLRPGRTTDGRDFWYVAIETSDSSSAKTFGVRVVNKLENAAGTGAVQPGRLVGGVLVTPGYVDFGPQHVVAGTPGTGFPPVTATPGSVADESYSPLVQLPSGAVVNAPVVADATGQHDKVVSLDAAARTVTLRLTRGFARGNAVRYLSTDATAPDVAALEGSTYVPRLAAAPSAGDDSTHSARASLAGFVNGPTGADNPQRQGINSALLGEGDPLNVLAWLPGQGRYSSLWDVHLTQWAPGRTASRVTRFADVEDLAESGAVTGPGGAPWAANDVIVNCPILALG
jgi:hypothetical protein